MELSNKDLDSLLLKANNFKENWLQSSDARDLEEAVELLRTILAHNSYEFRGKALRLIALLLYSVERLEEAEAYFRELSELEPLSESASSDYFYVLVRLNKVEAAFRQLEDFLANNILGSGFGCYLDMIRDHPSDFEDLVACPISKKFPLSTNTIYSALAKFANTQEPTLGFWEQRNRKLI